MRIFHNKETNQVITVVGDQAYSFYNYTHDNPVAAAIEFLDSNNSLTSLASTCDEIQKWKTDVLPKNPIIEKPTDAAEHEFKHRPSKELKCEHLPNQNKNPSSTT